MVDEATQSLKKYLKDKLSSPFYGTFIISWLLWNWKAWYVTFFIDSNLLFQTKGILKIDYILSFYPWGYFLNSIYFFIPPLVSAYLIIFWLPRITRKFYKKSLKNENVIKLIKLEEDRIIAEAEEKTFKAEEVKLDVEEKVLKKEIAVKKIKSEKSQEEKWEEEYRKFKESKYFIQFFSLKKTIYEKGGKTWENDGVGLGRHQLVSADFKAYLDVNEIVKIGKDTNGYEIVTLTEKGKYFMKKYTDEN
jgi:hypothetical protein